jgi:hypothetical protein
MDQVISAIRFDPTLPLPLLAALGGLCLLALALAAWRRAPGTAWRTLAFAALLAWLAGPRLVQETREGLPDIGLVVVDQSASMQVGDRAKLAEQARAALEQQAAKLPDLQLRTITVPESGNAGTRLFAAIDRALADIPRNRLAGIVALTDGQIHDIPTTPPPAPLHVLVPAKGEETDRRLRIIEAPSFGIVGKSVTLRVAIDDLGVTKPAAAARLTIRRDGEQPIIQSVPIGTPHDIEIPILRAGPSVIDLQAEPLPGEVSTQNNRAVVELNGVRDRLRVLLVSGEPNPGERTWRRLLKADPAVDLVHFTILRPPEKDDMTPLNELALIAFPVRELFQIKIREFDLIILDRFQNRGILPAAYLRNIADYVRQGGALLMGVGPEYVGPTTLSTTNLGPVLPALPAGPDAVETGVFRPAVTPLGQRHPVTAGLPGWQAKGAPTWGDWYREIRPDNVQGQTLMTGLNGDPLLVLNRVGEGRAAMLLSDQIWLWSRGHEGGGPQAELLRRIAHWLMKQPELEENALTARVANGRLQISRRTTDDTPPPPFTVTNPDGIKTQVAPTTQGPGLAAAALDATLPGVWTVSDGVRTAYAASGAANPPEIEDLRATTTKLAGLARASGGSVRFIATAGTPDLRDTELRRTEPEREQSGGDWIGLRRNHDHLVTGVAALPLLPAWFALPLILAFALLAWRREGR